MTGRGTPAMTDDDFSRKCQKTELREILIYLQIGILNEEMKKFIAFAFAVAVLCSCGPVKLVMDSHMSDGDRVILTSDKRLFQDVRIALGAKMNQKDTVLAVLITYDGKSDHGLISLDDRLLFRLGDGEEIALQNVYDKEYNRETESYTTRDRVSHVGYAYAYDPFYDGIYVTPVEVSSFIPRTHTRTVTESYGLYLISKKQLNDILSKGVTKFRVEIELDELDMVNGAESVKAVLAEQYDCLKKGFANPHHRSEF